MNKKLMALAVAGALAAPGYALAQATVYGRINAEFGFASEADDPAGAGRSSTDGFNSGASYIGFRAEEKLGGGLSVWIQCENRARFGADTNPAQGSGGFCDRNSAIGLKGGFGNVFVGRWDTASENLSGTTRLVGSTGWQGVQHMMTEDQGQFGISFAQRLQNLITYQSPNWGGFNIDVSVTTEGAMLNQPTASASTARSGRNMSAGAKYAGGPLVIYGTYEKQDDFANSVGGGAQGTSGTFMSLGASYQLGPVKIAAMYSTVDADVTAATNVERSSYQLGADWQLSPTGTIRAAYTVADDFEGNVAGAAAADQGAAQYQIQYIHRFSKHTFVNFYYVAVANEDNGVYNFHGFNTAVRAGETASAFAIQLQHNF